MEISSIIKRLLIDVVKYVFMLPNVFSVVYVNPGVIAKIYLRDILLPELIFSTGDLNIMRAQL